MNKKHGLGKGLSALIPENENVEEESGEKINLISIDLIKSNDKQPRKYFDEEKILELSESLKDHGMIQPVVLRKQGQIYEIVAGERRWRAAKIAGIKDLPAVIMDVTDKQLLEISLIENIQRQDLNPIEEAFAYKRLIEEFNLTQEELSSRLSKSRTSVTNCMRLLNLDERVQQYLIEAVISEGHGRALLSIEDKELQYKISQKVIDNSLSVRQTESLVRSLLKDESGEIKAKEVNPYIKDLKNKLQDFFGTKVDFNSGKKRGKIVIEYYSQEDLQRIIDLIDIK